MLREHQERILRVCFQRDATPHDLDALGNQERWLIYRQMLRARLMRVVQNAFPRTLKALGEEVTGGYFDEWLDQLPPQTRYFRDVPGEFSHHVRHKWKTSPPAFDWLPDLISLETSRWTRRFILPCEPPQSGELSFELAPVVNPTAELLELKHAVHKKAEKEAGYAPEVTHICVYRDFENHRVRIQILNPTASALLALWCRGEETLTESVQHTSGAMGFAIDERFIDTLGTMIASFIESGLLLGSAPQ